MTPAAAAVARYRERHRAAGLCIECPRAAAPGRMWCETCLTRVREYQREYQRRRRKRRTCRICRRVIPPGNRGHVTCSVECRAKWNRAWERQHPEAHRRAALAYQARHRAAGLCLRCPEPAARAGLCERHYAALRARERRA